MRAQSSGISPTPLNLGSSVNWWGGGYTIPPSRSLMKTMNRNTPRTSGVQCHLLAFSYTSCCWSPSSGPVHSADLPCSCSLSPYTNSLSMGFLWELEPKASVKFAWTLFTLFSHLSGQLFHYVSLSSQAWLSLGEHMLTIPDDLLGIHVPGNYF